MSITTVYLTSICRTYSLHRPLHTSTSLQGEKTRKKEKEKPANSRNYMCPHGASHQERGGRLSPTRCIGRTKRIANIPRVRSSTPFLTRQAALAPADDAFFAPLAAFAPLASVFRGCGWLAAAVQQLEVAVLVEKCVRRQLGDKRCSW